MDIASSKKKNLLDQLNQEDLKDLDLWLAANADILPSVVKNLISHYKLLLEGLAGNPRRLNSTLVELRRALGITPSSEKRKSSGDPIGPTSRPGDPKPRSPEERLKLSMERSKELAEWHKRMAKKHRDKASKMGKALMKVEDIELTPEDLEECARESAEYNKRLELGDGPDTALESPKQAFMQGSGVVVQEKTVEVNVDANLLADKKVISRLSEERTRCDFNISVTMVNVVVEKVVVQAEGSTTRIISASIRDIGPPKMDVTWEFLANLSIIVSQYAMPFNRLGSMLTTPGKSFTSGKLSRMFAYVAHRFLPIYLYNFRKLSNSRLLSGDDTSPLVLEAVRYFNAMKKNPRTAGEAPWLTYGNSQVASETIKKDIRPSLGALTAAELGFEFDRKDGNGQKKSLQTTVIWGRGEADDPRSAIVFYRSHVGGFGNLLSICLGRRDHELSDLIVSDRQSTSRTT